VMHISGNLLKNNISPQVKPFKDIRYMRTAERSK